MPVLWCLVALCLSAGSARVVRGLYLAWTGKYNVGDDAMFEVAQEMLGTLGAERDMVIVLVPYNPPASCNLFATDLRKYSFVMHGGGSILTKAEYLCDLERAHDQSLPVLVWGTGWDDEGSVSAQLDLLADPAFGSRKEDHITVEGPLLSSFEMAGRAAARGVAGGGVRGPYTSKVMSLVLAGLAERQGGDTSQTETNRRLALPMVGDSGLLAARLLRLPPNGGAEGNRSKEHARLQKALSVLKEALPSFAEVSVTQWLPKQLSGGGSGYRMMVVNYGCNKPGNSILHKDNRAVADAFVDAVVKLVTGTWLKPADPQIGTRSDHRGWVVVLTAMSGEDLVRVQEVYAAVEKKLKELPQQSQSVADLAGVGGAAVFVRCVLDTAGLLSLYQAAHLSINYKLHGNVLSAAVGTPFVAVAYHFKTTEFVDSLALLAADPDAGPGAGANSAPNISATAFRDSGLIVRSDNITDTSVLFAVRVLLLSPPEHASSHSSMRRICKQAVMAVAAKYTKMVRALLEQVEQRVELGATKRRDGDSAGDGAGDSIPPCEDGRAIADEQGNPLTCKILTSRGFSCEHYFCLDCDYAGYCDATCGFCSSRKVGAGASANTSAIVNSGGGTVVDTGGEHGGKPGGSQMFVIIGHQKCGTTKLFEMLRSHPQVKLPSRKEQHFFVRMQSKQHIAVYLRRFPRLHTGEFTGEATPDYVDDPYYAARRIAEHLPHARLIVLVRDPVTRAHAAWDQMRRASLASSTSIDSTSQNWCENRTFSQAVLDELPRARQCLQLMRQHWGRAGLSIRAAAAEEETFNNDCIAMCWTGHSHKTRPWCRRYVLKSAYAPLLQHWIRDSNSKYKKSVGFPPEQVLLLRSEELFADPRNVFKTVEGFLGLQPHQIGKDSNSSSASQTCWHDCDEPKTDITSDMEILEQLREFYKSSEKETAALFEAQAKRMKKSGWVDRT